MQGHTREHGTSCWIKNLDRVSSLSKTSAGKNLDLGSHFLHIFSIFSGATRRWGVHSQVIAYGFVTDSLAITSNFVISKLEVELHDFQRAFLFITYMRNSHAEVKQFALVHIARMTDFLGHATRSECVQRIVLYRSWSSPSSMITWWSTWLVTPFLEPDKSPYVVGQVVDAESEPLDQMLVEDGTGPMKRFTAPYDLVYAVHLLFGHCYRQLDHLDVEVMIVANAWLLKATS